MMRYIAKEPFKNGDTMPKKFRTQYEALFLVNNGSAALEFTLYASKGDASGFFAFTLAPGEVFDELVDPYEVINIMGSGTYKGFARDEVR